MQEEPGAYIDENRMPPNVPVFRDPKHWQKPELDAWNTHLLDGQDNLLPLSRVFCFRILPGTDQDLHTVIDEIRTTPVHGAILKLCPDEKLYTELMRATAEQSDSGDDTPTPQEDVCRHLPLARVTHVYPPFTLVLYQHLMRVHHSHSALCNLIHHVACIEQEGPVHCESGFSDLSDEPSAHIPLSHEPSLARSLLCPEFLPAAFFNVAAKDHSKWSLETLKKVVVQERPHIHPLTGTVYGGPLGGRTLLFAVSQVRQILDRIIAKGDIPASVKRLLRARATAWSHKQAESILNEVITALDGDYTRSQQILQQSAEARKDAWKNEVWLRAAKSTDQQNLRQDTGSALTSGVPLSHELLAAMCKELDLREDVWEEDASMLATDQQEVRMLKQIKAPTAGNVPAAEDDLDEAVDERDIPSTRASTPEPANVEPEQSPPSENVTDVLPEHVGESAQEAAVSGIERRRSTRQSKRDPRVDEYIAMDREDKQKRGRSERF
ncbi:hypothetical protein FRC12_018361 [Ceratobasidium sp. 428]|nr:hypothetical protein FRC12_018361 [Ceratobasidium sp. 428]